MSEKGSFSVKSSHMFVNTPVQEPVKSYFDKNYSSSNDKPIIQSQPRTTTDTQVSGGSQTGMAVRTTNMGLSDFY